MTNNLAFIDPDKCKLCMQCIDTCSVHNIIADNISPDKIAAVTQARLKREEKERQKKEEERIKAEQAENGSTITPEA
jgi:Na+-translocating ferredoxin:NAD+ oxidoreductase subunit B